MPDTTTCSGPACTRCTWSTAVGWCRSPATRCRSATTRAPSPSTSSAARPPRSSTSATWASSELHGPRRGAGARRAGAVLGHRPRRPAHALLAAHQRGRRRHRRRHDHERRRRPPDARRQRRRQGGRRRAPAGRPPRRGLRRAPPRPRPRWRCRARPPRPSWPATTRRPPSWSSCRPARRRIAGHPGRPQPLRLHRRGRLRDHRRRRPGTRTGPGAAGRARGGVRRLGRPRLAAARGRALPLRPRPRPPPPARSRPDSAWTIQARRRQEGGFPGAATILGQLRDGPARRRVGLRPEGRKPVRDGAALRRAADGDRLLGTVTSGGYGPTAGGPVAMGYVAGEAAAPGTTLVADERGTPVPCRVVELPFVPHRYFRGA